jgi:hypothetical protein
MQFEQVYWLVWWQTQTGEEHLQSFVSPEEVRARALMRHLLSDPINRNVALYRAAEDFEPFEQLFPGPPAPSRPRLVP